ncbi:MAG: putative selenate reductase subunit YgfK [Kiritimatiellae bacterium]|nr:putative selenate reductase subunit YgfK [Kiritimatiellia bacterium]
MTDRMIPLSCEALGAWLVKELETRHAMIGIPSALFFHPNPDDVFRVTIGDHELDTPIGVAAGPHTQLAQNIVAAWLCGARVIELKTVQELDELEVSKPCIDMQDAGYNVEWSQELRIGQSIDEYVKAWVLIHALHRHLGMGGTRPGVLFNMSIGYDLKGIRQNKVQTFLREMANAEEKIRACRSELERFFPWIWELEIPTRLSDQVTLSTMHGCPPDEIERIAAYLLSEQQLDTLVKLNPTLLGVPALEQILQHGLGFDDIQPARATCEKDLSFDQAIPMLKRLAALAREQGRLFGVKLSNTLAVENRRGVFSASEKEMYLSGRPLHPVTVQLAHRLREALAGESILYSFAGGADAFNVADLLACGMAMVTTCSDLLRPGSYSRLRQYLEEIQSAMASAKTNAIEAFILARAAGARVPDSAASNLAAYADRVLHDPAYRKDRFERTATKTPRTLGRFDCIQAPCTENCAIDQQVPEYLRLIAEGKYRDAARVIVQDNTMPCTLGKACPHPCELVCVRTHYDDPLAIRELKRFAFDHADAELPRGKAEGRTARVAIIGAGPCGLSVASELARVGYPVTLFEKSEAPGGMVATSIPAYRAENLTLARDLQRIQRLGVDVRYGQQGGVTFDLAALKQEGFAYLVLAGGAQGVSKLGIEHEDAEGVWDALSFLAEAKKGSLSSVGRRIGVVGGGDVAMDCARTAIRLVPDGEVSLIYRRTMKEMPAHREELDELLEENVDILELMSPTALTVKDGKLTGVVCSKNRLGDPDASGRRRPEPIPGAEETLALDTLVLAVNQVADHQGWMAREGIALNRKGFIEVNAATCETSLPDVFAGGDAMGPGPATIVKAMGDGRTIAREIRRRVEGVECSGSPIPTHTGWAQLMARKAHRQFRIAIPRTSPSERTTFTEVVKPLEETQARREASRCLECQSLCSLCTASCPNLAIQTYRTEPRSYRVPTFTRGSSGVEPRGDEPFHAAQGYQVLVLADQCNECGNCVTFCPTAGRPYRDKPRLYGSRSEWSQESDNAFFLDFGEANTPSHWALEGRYQGLTHRLSWHETCVYETPWLIAELDPETLVPTHVVAKEAWKEGVEVDLHPAAEMMVLMHALRHDASYLVEAITGERRS